MKSMMKGKIMKKLKTVKQIGYLNADKILHATAFDHFVDHLPFKPNLKSNLAQTIDAEELLTHQEDQDFEAENCTDDKENVRPTVCQETVDPQVEAHKSKVKVPLAEIDVSSFRRPDMDSGTLFDPNLLAVFEQVVSETMNAKETAKSGAKTCDKRKHKYPFFQPEYDDEPDPLSELEDRTDPLLEFEEKCPPGGSDSVIFYTTSLRGIRKTFEDCQSIRFLVESFGVIYYERDVSVHMEFREELWKVMGEKALPPRLFIRGRYIGGADKVLTLHEQGRLRPLFRDIPIDFSEGPCNVCSGLRFILCYTCNGSRKVFECEDQQRKIGGFWSQCLQCNENGLVVCPLC